MQACQEQMWNRQSLHCSPLHDVLPAFARRFSLDQFSDLKCAPLLLAADAACSYTLFTGNQRQALKVSCENMEFAAEIRALARRNVSAADSGVMSRRGPPSSSKPTMNLRIVAERSKGG
jgi:hypothetical protein